MKLQRPNRKRQLAGVCAALADYYKLNVDYVRLFFIALTLTAGFGLLFYLLLWIWIPEK